MKPPDDASEKPSPAAPNGGEAADEGLSEIDRILEDYLAALESGRDPHRRELLARYPQFARELSARLDALEFIHHIAPQLADVEGEVDEAGRSAVPAQQLGEYRIVRELGRGGMGVVYEAEQLSLGRRVALKVLPFASLLDERQLRRFKNEARAAATLDHPHIVSVYAVGSERGVHYYAMQFIDGQSLSKTIRALRGGQELTGDEAVAVPMRPDAATPEAGADPGPVVASEEFGLAETEAEAPCPSRGEGPRETFVEPDTASRFSSGKSSQRSRDRRELFRAVARLGIQVAEALDHAHSAGVLHRDIKPGNLLIDGAANAYVTDFGIARTVGEGGLTVSGDLLGTVRYMSPEQASARRGVVDHRSDIYSLGVTLYEVLTLEPAFQGSDREDLLRRIAVEDPRPPRAINRLIPAELETIVLKAVSKSPGERYATAQELADDLRRFLADEPIRAKRPTLYQRAAKLCRRHRAVVTAVIVTLVGALAVSTALIAWALKGERVQGRLAREARKRAEESELRTQNLLYAADVKLASRAWRDGDLRQFTECLDRHLPANSGVDLRGFEWYYLRQLPRSEHVNVAVGDEALYFVCHSPDGHLLATAGEGATVRVYEVGTYREQATIETGQGEVNGLAFSPDGRLLASAGDDGTVRTWDLATPDPIRVIEAHADEAYQVVFTPDGRLLVSCGNDPVIRLWDPRTGEPLGTLEGHTRAVEAISLAPDGRTLGSAGSDRQAVLWDLPSEQATRVVGSAHEDRLLSVAFSPDGRWVATGGIDKSVCIWRSRDGAFASRVVHLDGVQCVTFAPSGNLLAGGDRGGAVQVWGAVENSWSLARDSWEFEIDEVRWAAISGDGRWVAAATGDELLLRDVQSGEVRKLTVDPATLRAEPEEGHAGEIPFHVFSFSPSGLKLACVTEIYRSEPSAQAGWRLQTRLPEDVQNVSCVAFSPDDRLLATGLKDGSVALWDTATGERRGNWKAHRQDTWVLDADFSRDGQLLVTAGENGEIAVWEAATGKEKTRLDEQYDGYPSVALSPDGRRLAVGCRDEVRILDLPSGKRSAGYRGRNRGVSDVAFSPDGSLVASTGEWEVRIWKVETGTPVRKYPATATFVSFTQDGRSLLAGGGDAFVRLWDLDEDTPPQARPRTSLYAHGGRVYWLAFSPEGDGLASVGEEGRLIIWDPSPVAVETELVAPGRPTEDAAFARDGRLAVAARGEGVHLLDATTGTVTARLGGSGEEWLCVAASRRRDRLAAVSTAGMVSVWDLRTDRAPRTWQVGWGDGLDSLAFSPDGEMLAVCRWEDAGDAVLLFDASGGAMLHSFGANVPRAVAFSPDGRLVAFDSQNDVLVCDVEERIRLLTLHGHRNSIQALAFSPDGSLVVSGGKDRMVYLWDAESGERRFSLFGHPGDVSTVAFAPDGLTLVTADGSGSLKMWQVKTGQELLTLDRGPDEIKKVAFSPDGKQLALMFESGSVRTIHVP